MIGNPAYALYTPDNVKVEKLSRNFLLTLVAYIDPNLYKSFYSIYKEQTAERKYNKWVNYTIDIKSDILEKVKQFVPTDQNNSGNKSFKLTKNHMPNCTFKKSEIQNINIRNHSYQNMADTLPKKSIKIMLNSGNNDSSNLLSFEKKKLNKKILILIK